MKCVSLSLALALAVAGSAAAHHSGAMFERGKTVQLTGTIKEFGWNNPHSWIRIAASDTPGAAPKEWMIEMNSPAFLARAGWTKSIIKPGDKVQMTVTPLRSGEPGGAFRSLTLPDGRVLSEKTTAE